MAELKFKFGFVNIYVFALDHVTINLKSLKPFLEDHVLLAYKRQPCSSIHYNPSAHSFT